MAAPAPPDGPLPEWLQRLAVREARPGPFGLHVIRGLLARLGHPEHGLVVVHVAGSRGKGSTSALVAAALHAAGHRTGLTTSPHLLHPRERIRVAEADLTEDAFLSLTREVLDRGSDLEPSFFETITAAAVLAFARARVDVAVVETGLGGRLDATTALPAAVAVLTRLGRDHADRLGPTAESVAYEKAGIVVPGARVVLGPNAPEAARVVERRARELGCALRQVGDAELEAAPQSPLPGRVQRENAATAWAALEELAAATAGKTRTTREEAERGFAAVRWPCRLQRVAPADGGAAVLLDVAHDLDGVRALLEHLDERGERATAVVFACLADKDLGGMAALLGRHAATRAAVVHVPELASWRARPAAGVAAELAAAGLETVVAPDAALALDAARARAGGSGLVAAFGSFLVVEGVVRRLREIGPDPLAALPAR